MTPSGSPAANVLLANFPLRETFTLETVVSLVWNFDKDGDGDSLHSIKGDFGKYYDIDYDFDGSLGQGSVSLGENIEFLSRKEYARFNEKGVLTNGDVIEAIGEIEAAKIYNQFRDRYFGSIDIPGWATGVELNGNMTSINFSFSEGGAPQTNVNLSETPPPKGLEMMLPDPMRRYVFRQIDPGGG